MIICVNVSQTKIISVINFVGWFLVFNTTFNNISVISWWSVLLVEETGVLSTPHHERGSNSQL